MTAADLSPASADPSAAVRRVEVRSEPDAMSIAGIYELALVEFGNGSESPALFNGCAHEGDRLMRIAFDESVRVDAEERGKCLESINAEFYHCYGDAVFFIGLLSGNQGELEEAMDAALDIYRNLDGDCIGTDVRRARCLLVKDWLGNRNGSAVQSFFAAAKNGPSEAVIPVYYYTYLGFQRCPLMAEAISGCLGHIYSAITAVSLDSVSLVLTKKVVGEVYLLYALGLKNRSPKRIEAALDNALDFLECAADDAADGQFPEMYFACEALVGYAFWKLSDCCRPKKIPRIREMIGSILDTLDANQHECMLPACYIENLAAIKAFAGQDDRQ